MRRVMAVGLIALAPVLASAQMKVGGQQKVTSANPNVVITTSTESSQPSLESARRITRDEAMKLVKQQKAIIVDVRSKESFDVGHIKGAVSIPGSQLISRLREIPPGRMIITYCA